MRGHRDLVAWQKAMELVAEIYQVTRGFPKEELGRMLTGLRSWSANVGD